MASFNLPEDLRRILNLPSGDNILTDTELQDYLDEANNDFRAQVKRYYEQDMFFATSQKNTGNLIYEYTLALTPVVSIYKVLVNGEEKTVTTDYSLDTTRQKIVFVEGAIEEGNEIIIQYIPQIYYLTELFMAANNILLRTNLINQNGENNPVLKNYNDKINTYINMICNRTLMGTYS